MKNKLLITIIVALLTWCNIDYDVCAKYMVDENTVLENVDDIGQQIADFAVQYVGNPYVWSGTSLETGADCSGFAYAVFREFNIDLPRVSDDQFNSGEFVELDDRMPGDLLFYGYGNSYSDHTAIYIGDNKIVHSRNSQYGVVVSDWDYWNCIGCRRYW